MGTRFEAITSLFARGRHLDPSEREAFLREACGDDASLRDEVLDLLRAHDAAPSKGEDPLVQSAAGDLAARVIDEVAAAPGDLPRVEGFRILRRLAEGGMGTVFLAEQEKPRRSVALKVLHPEAATLEGRRRFEREAEVLARLEHPGIARVLVFGTTAPPGEPRPFLAMELVEGEPLTAVAARMAWRDRLVLLAEVAEAVAHAHTRGVIHRDLKPDNILVQADGRPKVVDFGVARLLEDDAALRTRAGLVIGTLAYMSPEQARGDAGTVDTRSDVYALGVIAYEVLTGRHPLGDETGTFPEVVQRICTEAPPDPGAIDRRLRGDLRLILGKALEKEPEQRYAGASALADDLRRHLRDEPILARPMTGGYQVRRLVRRHKRAVAFGAVAILALVGGLVLALDLARTARAERARADVGAETLRRSLARRSVELAAAALRQNEAEGAVAALGQVPADLRGWEWEHLAAAADGSFESETAKFADLRDARFEASGRDWIGREADGALWARGGEGVPPRRVSSSAVGAEASLALLGGAPVLVGRRGAEVSLADASGHARWTARSPIDKPLQAVAGSRDGRLLALAYGGGVGSCPLFLVEAASGDVLWSTSSGPVQTGALALSRDGSLLACGGWDGHVRLIDSGARKTRARLAGHVDFVTALEFSEDATRLASGSKDRTARLWDVTSGAALHRLTGHTGEVAVVAFSPDGTRLATAGSDATVRVWDVATGAPLRMLVGHHGAVRAARFLDGDVLATLARDGLRLWRVGPDPGVIRAHRSVAEGNLRPYVYAVSFSPDGRFLASGAWDGTVRIVDVATGDLLATIDSGEPSVFDVKWTPDGRWLVGGHLRLVRWDPFTGEEVAVWKGAPLRSVVVTRDGAKVVSAGEDGIVRVHAASNLARTTQWRENGGHLADLSVPPQGDRVASLSERGDLVVRAIGGGEPLWQRMAHPRSPFGSVSFSPDGRHVATGGGDRLVRLWDAETGNEEAALAGHSDSVYALAWLPGGTRLVSGSNDATVRVWDPQSRNACLEMRGHGSYVYRLDVSPDGSTVASASGDGTVRLWTTRSTARRERDRRERVAARAAADAELTAALGAGTRVQDLADAAFRDPAADPAAKAVRLEALLRRAPRARSGPVKAETPARVDAGSTGD